MTTGQSGAHCAGASRQIVREGMQDGSLRQVDAVVDGPHRDVERRGGTELVPRRAEPPEDPVRCGRFVADLTVAGLLSSSRRLEAVRRQADELDDAALPL